MAKKRSANKPHQSKQKTQPQNESPLEAAFLLLLSNCPDIPTPEREHRFAPPRRFRFDFAWVDKKVAVEIEGGLWNRGRHNSPQGFINDCTKYNLALEQGWRVLRYTSQHIQSDYPNMLIQLSRVLGVPLPPFVDTSK